MAPKKKKEEDLCLVDLDKFITKVRDRKTLSKDETRVLCKHVESMLTEESCVRKVPSPVTVCGFDDLKKLLKKKAPIPPDTNCIFMGDFLDLDLDLDLEYNLEVFTTLLLLKARYPEKITLFRGKSSQPTLVKENDSAWKYCTDVIDCFTPSPNIDGIVVFVSGSNIQTLGQGTKKNIQTLDQMPILCPLTNTPIREPHLVDGWQSRYMTEFTELGFIAEGSYGHVCKARNNLDEKEYAIKKILLKSMLVDVHKQEPVPFLYAKRELIAMSQMNHPNVIRYYQAWIEPRFAKTKFTKDDDQLAEALKDDATILDSPCLYIQLQYCKRPLKDFLTDPSTTPLARVRVWREIVDGLSHVHSRRYIHCDLSRSNILLDDEDTAIIADFGLAQRFEEERIRLKPNHHPGFWTPPEIEARKEDIGVKADIFSLGFIAYELFCMLPQYAAVLDRDFQNLKKGKVSEAWMSVYARSMLIHMVSPDPDDRPSLQEISDALEHNLLEMERETGDV